MKPRRRSRLAASGNAAVGLDVSGHSNDDCTLSVTDGETTLTYDVAAPTPPLTDAPADALAPPAPCFVAGVSSRSRRPPSR